MRHRSRHLRALVWNAAGHCSRRTLLTVLLLVLGAANLRASEFVVDSTADEIDATPGDGICAAVGVGCTLRAAVIEANKLPGWDTIQVPAGTYSLSGALEVSDSVSIRGVGAGATILDAGGLGPALRLWAGDVVPPSGAIEISRMTVTGGSFAGIAVGFLAGSAATVQVADCVIQGNDGLGLDTGVASDVKILRTGILDNGGAPLGFAFGWICCGRVDIDHSLIRGNGVSGSSDMLLTSTALRITNSVVEGNVNWWLSGDGASIVVEDSLFRGNSGHSAISTGSDSTLEIRRTTIENNVGTYAGGIDKTFSGQLILEDSTITRNTATYGAGGIRSEQIGNATIRNTTISQNIGSTVGGLLVTSPGAVSLYSVTIAGNHGGIVGGLGLDSMVPGGPIVRLQSTVIAGNDSAGVANDCGMTNDSYDEIDSLGGNLIGDGTACPFLTQPSDLVGSGGSPIDPLLSPLAPNGGATDTHALLPGSPALEAGGSLCSVTDQRGVARPFDADGDGFALCDIGAYESADVDGDGIGDSLDNCPTDANSDQVDNDGDALGDVCDSCPTYPGDDVDGDGIDCALDNCKTIHNTDQEDFDGDSVGNACDNCIEVVNPDQANSDADVIGDVCDNCRIIPNANQADVDADLIGDVCDSCPSVSNSYYSDTDGDGVQDACDNCTTVANPRIYNLLYDSTRWLSWYPWALLTGGQRDDDGDGYGNVCDAKFPGSPGLLVGSGDLAEYRASSGKSRAESNCGRSGLLPCSIFDLDESGELVSSGDLARYRQLTGRPPGPKCAACPLTCDAGASRSCEPY